jgi:hypothetical protein
MVREPRMRSQAVWAGSRVPVRAEVGVGHVGDLVLARGGVHWRPSAAPGVVVAKADVEASGILQW